MHPLECENLLVNVGERRLLGPLTTSFDEARIGIIGANGSGKTTLLRVLMGLTHHTSGTVNGSANGAHGVVRPQCGMMFSNPDIQLLMPTVQEDIDLSHRVRRKRKNQTPLGLAESKAIATILHRIPPEQAISALSAGEKQLVALASTLATAPQTILCDEPGAHLDLPWKSFVYDLLLASPVKLIVATHDLELAARMDRVLVLDSGRAIFDGPPKHAIDAYRNIAAQHLGRLAHA